jgi:hypothetical protein
MFMGLCIVNQSQQLSNKMRLYTVYYISLAALHVSGGNPTNHQEHTTVHTASDTVN